MQRPKQITRENVIMQQMYLDKLMKQINYRQDLVNEMRRRAEIGEVEATKIDWCEKAQKEIDVDRRWIVAAQQWLDEDKRRLDEGTNIPPNKDERWLDAACRFYKLFPEHKKGQEPMNFFLMKEGQKMCEEDRRRLYEPIPPMENSKCILF